jgi:hypothetical protein
MMVLGWVEHVAAGRPTGDAPDGHLKQADGIGKVGDHISIHCGADSDTTPCLPENDVAHRRARSCPGAPSLSPRASRPRYIC